MNSGGIEHKITVFMTPKDLREIADAMETRWSEVELGHCLSVKEWDVAERVRLVFVIDQDRMERQAGPWGRRGG